ncbi:MAG: hypothetical protein ACI88S_001875, partial [Ilumatobacter sp.]
ALRAAFAKPPPTAAALIAPVRPIMLRRVHRFGWTSF